MYVNCTPTSEGSIKTDLLQQSETGLIVVKMSIDMVGISLPDFLEKEH